MKMKIFQVIAVVIVASFFGLKNAYEEAIVASKARIALCAENPLHATCVAWDEAVANAVYTFNGVVYESDRTTMYAAGEE